MSDISDKANFSLDTGITPCKADILAVSPKPSEKKTPHHAGHRGRLKEKFLQNGADALADYELLELALFYFIPQKDVKPLAKELLTRFGNIANVLHADPGLLRECDGVKDGVVTGFKLLAAVATEINRVQARDGIVLDKFQALCDYVRTKIGFAGREEFHVLFLNRQNYLIADEILQTGTVDKAAIYPRELIKRALAHGAAGFAIAHNHPSGVLTPSRPDIDVTKQIVAAAKVMDMYVLDHLIVSKTGVYSFRKEGLIA